MKRPSFQFYPGDWMRDSALRSCSVGARGLWMDMICLMHEGNPYGYLKVNLKVILSDNLARIVGATLLEVEGWLGELDAAGVFSRDDSGCIFSRRMIRDESIRESRASGGKLGGNPTLKVIGKVGEKVNLPANLQPTPSSSSSSSSSSAIHEEKAGTATPSAPARPKKEKRSDDDFIADLKTSPAYAGIDIDREFAKMRIWCQTKGKAPSQARLVNWLNRIEKPMTTATAAPRWQPTEEGGF